MLQSVQPWLSSKDITFGTRWSSVLSDVLAETDVGIVCLTADNLAANWLLFEAGALSKASKVKLLGSSRGHAAFTSTATPRSRRRWRSRLVSWFLSRCSKW